MFYLRFKKKGEKVNSKFQTIQKLSNEPILAGKYFWSEYINYCRRPSMSHFWREYFWSQYYLIIAGHHMSHIATKYYLTIAGLLLALDRKYITGPTKSCRVNKHRVQRQYAQSDLFNLMCLLTNSRMLLNITRIIRVWYYSHTPTCWFFHYHPIRR